MTSLPSREVDLLAGSARSSLLRAYVRARTVIAGVAILSSTTVGFINGWPRGPAVPLVALLVATHSVAIYRRRVAAPTPILLIDAVAISVATVSMGIPTVALLSMAFLMVAAAVLERGRRVYVLWSVQMLLVLAALGASIAVPLPSYSADQAAVSEAVGVLFFTVATVGLTKTLVTALLHMDRRRHAAEREVDARERRYRAMLAHSSDGVTVTDDRLRVLEVGEQNHRLHGYARDERIGGSMLDLVVAEDREIVMRAHAKVLTDPTTTARMRVRIRGRNGEIRVMDGVESSRIDDPDIGGYVFNLHDVTGEEDANERLSEANARLEESIRSKAEFIASVSHELRTPLTAVVGMAELLAEDDADEHTRTELTAILLSEARHAAAIVEDLLVAAMADVDQIPIVSESCSLSDAVAATVRGLQPDRPVSVDVSARHLAIADPVRTSQIVRNLIGNAVRHGGHSIWVTSQATADTVALEVADNGPGIERSVAEHLFEPYQRSTPKGPTRSTGLGLSVSHTLARLMGGDITYRREGDRTIFELSLPSAPALRLAMDQQIQRGSRDGSTPSTTLAS